MAVQAPMHQQRTGLKYQGHLVDLTMAGRAANAFVDVNAVIEIDVVREPMHTNPLDGFIRPVTFAYGLQISGVIEENRMAVHTGLGRGNSGGGGGFDAGMTITAIDPIVAHMMFVAELDGLLPRDVLIRQIRSARQTHHSTKAQCGE